MSVLSKFFGGTLGMRLEPANCYEVGHTWHPDCNVAIKLAIWDAAIFCLKTYSTVYVASGLLSVGGNVKKMKWRSIVRNTIQSSVFLTMNMVWYLWFFCVIRKAMGFFIWPTMGLSNGLLSSFLAILLENKNRRGTLALYLTNIASEAAYKQLVRRGLAPSFARGEIIPLMLGLAAFFGLRSRGRLDKSVGGILNKLFHLAEDGEKPADIVQNVEKLSPKLRAALEKLRASHIRSARCTHAHSCPANALEASGKNFGYGLAASVALTLVKGLMKNWRRPSRIGSALFSLDTLALPAFAALMPLLYHSTRCAINHHAPQSKNDLLREIVAGGISGAAMLVYPSVNISMYILWKGIEALYFDAASRGKLPIIPHGDVLLYTISTGYVLGLALIEPQSVRSNYIHFLGGLTGKKLSVFNRTLFDPFGFESTTLYPNFHPKLDPVRTTLNPMLYQPVRK